MTAFLPMSVGSFENTAQNGCDPLSTIEQDGYIHRRRIRFSLNVNYC